MAAADHERPRFPILVAQMREILQATPGFARATVAARQDMYEQLAIVGMLMATARMSSRDSKAVEKLRAAGKGYLEQFLRVDADRVQIGTTGLVIAPTR